MVALGALVCCEGLCWVPGVYAGENSEGRVAACCSKLMVSGGARGPTN